MSTRQVAVRLKAEGGGDVLREVAKVDQALDQMGSKGAASSDRLTAAADREVAALREIAVAAQQAETALQRQINAATGVSGGSAGNAAASARVLGAGDDIYERKARELKAALDPAAAAQDRLNKELAEYNTLAKRGKITTEELAQAQLVARKRFDETERQLGKNKGGLSRLEQASRLNLTRQGADVMVTAAMGMNPAMIAMQQGPQILDAWATSGIKAGGAMIALAGAVVVVAGAIAAMGVAYLQGEQSFNALDRAASGLGRTAKLSADELKAAADAGAEAAEISRSAAEKQAIAYVSTGRIGGEVLTGLIALSKDYAAFTGKDMKEATQQLADDFANPAEAAREMTRQFGLMDQKTLDTIDSLMKQGDRLAAQKLLLEALTDAVEGHSQKVGEISSLWDAAAVSVSNYWKAMGEALYETPQERIDRLAVAANGPATGRSSNYGVNNETSRNRAYGDWTIEVIRQGLGTIVDDMKADRAAENQKEQDKKDKADKPKKGPRGKSAEQLAREALARQRREEDVQAGLNLQVARSVEDYDLIRQLESEARIRQRIRQLVDDGTKLDAARIKAAEEEAKLLEAQKVTRDEAGLQMQRQAEMEVMRLLGEDRSLQNLQDRIAKEDQIKAYQKAGYDLVTATNLAERDRNNLIEARAVALRRANAEAEADHQANLARLRGDDDLSRYYDIERRIEDRARQIERRKGLNEGEGVDEAQNQIQEELNAEAIGARKSWIRGLLGDIKSSNLGDVVANQLDRATDHWLDKLSESLAELDWSGFLSSLFGGKGQGGGWGNALGSLFGSKENASGAASAASGFSLFKPSTWFGSGHSTGTEYSDGGWKWVGERGPELLKLGRGSSVMEHNRSLNFARSGGGAPTLSIGALRVNNYGTEPVTASAKMTPEGDLELLLEPAIEKGIAKSGRKGNLAKAFKASPRTTKRS